MFELFFRLTVSPAIYFWIPLAHGLVLPGRATFTPRCAPVAVCTDAQGRRESSLGGHDGCFTGSFMHGYYFPQPRQPTQHGTAPPIASTPHGQVLDSEGGERGGARRDTRTRCSERQVVAEIGPPCSFRSRGGVGTPEHVWFPFAQPFRPPGFAAFIHQPLSPPCLYSICIPCPRARLCWVGYVSPRCAPVTVCTDAQGRREPSLSSRGGCVIVPVWTYIFPQQQNPNQPVLLLHEDIDPTRSSARQGGGVRGHGN